MGNIINVESLPNTAASFHLAIPSSGWSSTKTDGYYTNTVSLGGTINTIYQPTVSISGSTVDTVPTTAQSAAYNLVDVYSFANGTAVTQMVAKAKTKPTETFYIILRGGDESTGAVDYTDDINRIDANITELASTVAAIKGINFMRPEEGADCNSINNNQGFYICYIANGTNTPSTTDKTGMLVTFSFAAWESFQFFVASTNKIFWRFENGSAGSWTSWTQL